MDFCVIQCLTVSPFHLFSTFSLIKTIYHSQLRDGSFGPKLIDTRILALQLTVHFIIIYIFAYVVLGQLVNLYS